MPYSSNSDLPEAVRSRYSEHCQSVWRNVWNSIYENTEDESRAYAGANAKAKECEGKKNMTPTFKIFAPMLTTSFGPDGRKRLHGVASSTVKDKHGDTMTLSALSDMERSATQNMTIFLNHEYRVPEDVAGTVEKASIRPHPQDPEIHDLTLDIVINESNPRAVQAWEAIEGGTQLGLSIGAMIPEGGAIRDRKSGSYVIEHIDLLETSLVGVPANPRSWVEYAVKSLKAIEIPEAEPEEDFDPEEVEIETEQAPDEQEEVPAFVVTETANGAINDYITTTTTTTNGSYVITTEPEITNATVSISTPYADINIDTGNRGGNKPAANGGSSQEALASTPENEDEEEAEKPNPWAAIGLSGEPDIEDVEPALQILEPTVVASLRNSTDLLRAVTRELIDTKKALDDAILERDAAIAATEQVLANTSQILERLASTPVGRRAVYREASDSFTSLKSVYGEEFVTLLQKG